MAYVQSASIVNGSAGARSLAFAGSNTAGNLLVVAIMLESSTATISTVTDTAGNTWTPVGTLFTGGSLTTSVQFYYAKNCLSGANTITVTPSASVLVTLHLYEISGMSTTAPLDDHKEAGSVSTNPASGALTTTATGDAIIAFAASNSGNPTAGSGYTIRETAGWNDFTVTEEKTAGVAGSYDGDFVEVSNTWVAMSVAFKTTGASSPAGRFISLMGVG